MKTRAWIILLAVSVATNIAGQTPTNLRSGDRPVFMSADRLALLCEDWGTLHPGGQPPKDTDTLKVSTQEIVRSSACEAYILGVQDRSLEDKMGARYRPVPSELDYMKTLIDTFLKYLKDHPELQDFAASTVLDKAERIILQSQSGRP